MPRVHHMVLLRFKPSASQESIGRLFAALQRLRQTIASMEHYAAGPYASSEGLNQGFTHGFLMTFADAAARDKYLVHPAHEKVKDEFLPLVENVVAFDFAEGQ